MLLIQETANQMHMYIYLYGGSNKGHLGYATCSSGHDNYGIQHTFTNNQRTSSVSGGQIIAIYSQMASSNFSRFNNSSAYTFACRFEYTLKIKVTE